MTEPGGESTDGLVVVWCGELREQERGPAEVGRGRVRTLFSSFRFAVDEGEREREKERERGWGEKRDRWQSGEAAASAGTAQPGRTQLPPPASFQMPPFPHPPSPHPPSLALI